MSPGVTTMSEAKRQDRSVKIERDLAEKAKLIADMKEISIAEYLSKILRPQIEKDLPGAVKKLQGTPGRKENE